MPKDKQLTTQRIISSAKKEFLKKGFEGASMHQIAAGAGITAPALYRHFENKEKMFGYLVTPVTEYFNRNRVEVVEELEESLKHMKPSDLWKYAQNNSDEMFEWVYDNFEELKLILTCSAGTKYESFFKEYVDNDVDITYEMMEIMKSYGNISRLPIKSDLHMLMTGYYAMFMEFVVSDYTREEAKRAGDIMTDFFYAGWNKVFSLE